MAYKEDVQSGTIAYIGVVSVLGLLVIVLALRVIFYGYKAELQYEREHGAATTLKAVERANLVAKQRAALVSTRVIDRSKGIVTIPISQAMELVVRKLNAGRPATSSVLREASSILAVSAAQTSSRVSARPAAHAVSGKGGKKQRSASRPKRPAEDGTIDLDDLGAEK